MMMRTFRLHMHFTTPAFMGNAEQSAQWRAPPIKALLRQWWRVAYAADKGFAVSVDKMRQEEGLLFGHAWLENDTFERAGKQIKTAARKSQIRIRLDRWNEGKLKQSDWPHLDHVNHPEVGRLIASDLYLGFGPVTLPKGASHPTLKAHAALQAWEAAQISIAVPDQSAALIQRALWLMDRYGTLGGRSRNGWGSFTLTSHDGEPPLSGKSPERPWRQALDSDWPHAIGCDDTGPLIWQTRPHAPDDWKSLIKTLAEIKIGLRRQFRFTTGRDAGRPEDRHWLSYPVTHHSVRSWGNNARLPNTLRFKVRKIADDQLVGVIFHVPHLPPAAFSPDKRAIETVWMQVHRFLDLPAQKLGRISE